jgi:hypothetical protein
MSDFDLEQEKIRSRFFAAALREIAAKADDARQLPLTDAHRGGYVDGLSEARSIAVEALSKWGESA